MIEMHPKLAMLAKAGDPDSIEGAVMEPKLDGHRVLAFIDSDGVRLYARTGVDKTAKLPTIAAALRTLPVGTILDGEVIAWNRTGGDWSSVQSVLGADDGRSDEALVYVVFDALALAGEDVMLNPLHVRRAYLEMLFPEARGPLELIKQDPYDAVVMGDLIADGWEGVIVKSIHGTYQPGRRGWIKVKATHTEDVVVMGATEGKGRFAGQIGALIFGQYVMEDDHVCTLVEKGQCSGMDDAERIDFTARRDGKPGMTPLVGMVIEVSHMGKMPSGGWRHPQFKRIRTDKLATDCVAS